MLLVLLEVEEVVLLEVTIVQMETTLEVIMMVAVDPPLLIQKRYLQEK
jgi:hypothetical protein